MSDRDYEDTVRWLSRARELERRIELRSEQAERLRQSLMPGAARGDGAPGSKPADWTDRANAAMEIEQEIAGEIRRLRRVRAEIVRAIERVEDENQRTVLELRYIAGLRFEKIAARMSYDRTWVWKLHKRGVMAVAKSVNTSQHKSVL